MAKYDGLIIPRSYSEYINKTDAATHQQAHQLSGVLDDAPTEDSVKAVKSGGVFNALAGKQPTLTFDDEPTDGSTNPVKSNGIYDAMKALLPVGLVFPFAGTTVPDSFLECNGAAVSRTTYAELFAVIGTTYGTGDGSTTFNLPDYREVALVGAGQNATDSIADHDVYTVGQFKDDQVQSHAHDINPNIGANQYGNRYIGGGSDYWYSMLSELGTYTTTAMSGRKGSVTRGKRKGVKYIIKVL